jgi:oxygen-independent coproporphyrinogen III oxidase
MGIYLHIPFCKQACTYCDFYFTTSLKNRDVFIQTLLKEIQLRNNYLSDKNISTVYFGGGTPSLLTSGELTQIFQSIKREYNIEPGAEITLECNPDDIHEENLKNWISAGINRLSIGLQSFNDEELKQMNRAHHAEDGIKGVQLAQAHGFKNISVDLIYGSPWLDHLQWENNLETVLSLNVQHISCYQMTVEPKTALHQWIKSGKSKPVDDEKTADQFSRLIEVMKKNGFIHYEVSNFCKEGFHSRHNSSYWKDVPYLGLGPSAHSYNGNTRQHNIANLPQYISRIEKNEVFYEVETLTPAEKYNELVLTGLRTIWGLDIRKIEEKCGPVFVKHLLLQAAPYVHNKQLIAENHVLRLAEEAFLFADRISTDLFYI